MDHSEQVRCSRRLLDHIANHETDMADSVYRHPVSDFTSAGQLSREKSRLFRGFPIFVGFSSDLGAPGDFLSEVFAGVPVLVVRGQDGRLRAFLNMCPHRGTQVAAGCGKGAKNFVCPYHGWTFKPDGTFFRMSMERGFAQVDRAELDLRPLPATEQYGLMWIGLDPDVTLDVDELLRDFKSDFAAYGFGTYHHYKTMVMVKKMNWKMVIDTFLENYHLKVLHRKTIKGAILSDLQLVDASGSCQRLIQARRGFVEHVQSCPETEWDLLKHSATTYVLFPNTFFIWQMDHVEIWRAFPDGDDPNASKVYFDVYVPEPAESEKARKYWDTNIDYGVSIVLGEDFPLSEETQANFKSGVRDFVTFGRNEPGLINYHRAINRAIGVAVERGDDAKV